MEERPNCEVCGKPAIYIVRDTEPDFDGRDIGINAKKPSGSIHFFCEECVRESIHYDID